MALPGPGTVFLSQNWKFTAPVYIGDTITAEAEIVSVHESKPVCQLKIKVARQTGETVLEGEAWCYRLGPHDRYGFSVTTISVSPSALPYRPPASVHRTHPS